MAATAEAFAPPDENQIDPSEPDAKEKKAKASSTGNGWPAAAPQQMSAKQHGRRRRQHSLVALPSLQAELFWATILFALSWWWLYQYLANITLVMTSRQPQNVLSAFVFLTAFGVMSVLNLAHKFASLHIVKTVRKSTEEWRQAQGGMGAGVVMQQAESSRDVEQYWQQQTAMQVAAARQQIKAEHPAELRRQQQQFHRGARTVRQQLLSKFKEKKQMTSGEYRAILKQQGLIKDDQAVCHIIAVANGGADHPDNYMVLSGSFNSLSGTRLDHVNCFLAGMKLAQLAVAASKRYSYYRGPSAKVWFQLGRTAVREMHQLQKYQYHNCQPMSL